MDTHNLSIHSYYISATMSSYVHHTCPTRYTSEASLLALLKRYFSYMDKKDFQLKVSLSKALVILQ
jgi:hypothetical protein